MTLGNKLSKLRRENNYTQEQLADTLGVSRQAISKWESDTAYPETDKLIQLSRLFHCTTDYLLLEDQETAESPSPSQGRTGRIFIESPLTKNVVSCQKVTASKVLAPTKNQPEYLLLGVDKVTFLGDHTTLLGGYRTEEELQKEVEAISSAIQRGENLYTLQYDTAMDDTGRLKETKSARSNLPPVVKALLMTLTAVLLLLALGAIFPRWIELFLEFGRNLYRMTH